MQPLRRAREVKLLCYCQETTQMTKLNQLISYGLFYPGTFQPTTVADVLLASAMKVLKTSWRGRVQNPEPRDARQDHHRQGDLGEQAAA